MTEKQKTIGKEISLKGKGLHSGRDVNLTLKPAIADYGYRFKRIDLDTQPEIRALAENVTTTSRGTTLVENSAEVMTLEHLCAALYASRIDNVLVELDGPEVPILDGSAKYFIRAINEAGISELVEEKKFFSIQQKLVYREEEKDIEIAIYPADEFSVEVEIDFDSKVLGTQHASLHSLSDFESEIASCKTFVFLHELEMLLQHNLIKGGDVDNALVIVDKPMSKEGLDHLAELFNKPKVEVLPQGYLNNTELTFENEPARHKLLDIIGDLSLTGVPLKGKIVARKPGHHANTELAKMIRKLVLKEQ